MQGLSRFRPSIGIAMLLSCAAFATVADASSLAFSGLRFNQPVFQANNPSTFDDIISNTTVNQEIDSYSYSAEFCVSGLCSFDPPNSPATSTLKLSNLSLTCTVLSGGTCAPLDVTFQAGFEVSPGSLESISVTLDNTSFSGSGYTGFARICFSDMDHICAADLTGTSSFSFGFSNGTFTTGSPSGLYMVGAAGPFQVLGIFHIDGLGAGGSINLGQSLKITTHEVAFDVGSPPVPEPATVLLLPFGAIALLALRRIRRS